MSERIRGRGGYGSDKALYVPVGKQDMAEVAVTINTRKYCQKWYGEDEKTDKVRTHGYARSKAFKDEDA